MTTSGASMPRSAREITATRSALGTIGDLQCGEACGSSALMRASSCATSRFKRSSCCAAGVRILRAAPVRDDPIVASIDRRQAGVANRRRRAARGERLRQSRSQRSRSRRRSGGRRRHGSIRSVMMELSAMVAKRMVPRTIRPMADLACACESSRLDAPCFGACNGRFGRRDALHGARRRRSAAVCSMENRLLGRGTKPALQLAFEPLSCVEAAW